MTWKLWTEDTGPNPPVVSAEYFDSKEAALAKACEMIRAPVRVGDRVSVVRIEGPDGEPISRDEIATLCGVA